MESFFEAYWNVFRSLTESMKETIRDVPQAGLDWSPDNGENSIAVLAVHTIGANQFLIQQILLGGAIDRDRDAEFRARGLDADALLQRIDTHTEEIASALATLTLTDLNSERIHPRTGKPITAAWALLHALEHTALHTGHMEMTRKAWETASR